MFSKMRRIRRLSDKQELLFERLEEETTRFVEFRTKAEGMMNEIQNLISILSEKTDRIRERIDLRDIRLDNKSLYELDDSIVKANLLMVVNLETSEHTIVKNFDVIKNGDRRYLFAYNELPSDLANSQLRLIYLNYKGD